MAQWLPLLPAQRLAHFPTRWLHRVDFQSLTLTVQGNAVELFHRLDGVAPAFVVFMLERSSWTLCGRTQNLVDGGKKTVPILKIAFK